MVIRGRWQDAEPPDSGGPVDREIRAIETALMGRNPGKKRVARVPELRGEAKRRIVDPGEV